MSSTSGEISGMYVAPIIAAGEGIEKSVEKYTEMADYYKVGPDDGMKPGSQWPARLAYERR